MRRDLGKYSQNYESDYGFEAVVVAYRQRLLIERLKSLQPAVVVEVGCGSDMLYEAWLRAGGTSECWVVVEPAERFAAKAADANLPRLHVIQDYFEDAATEVLGTLPRRPDLIICSSLLHEVPDPDRLLLAARTVMDQQTRLHINVPNSESLHRRLAHAMGLISETKTLSERNRTLMQYRVYDEEGLRAQLAAAGLRVVDEGGYLLKPWSHEQMEKVWSELGAGVLDGLYLLGRDMPGLASEIWSESRLSGAPRR